MLHHKVREIREHAIDLQLVEEGREQIREGLESLRQFIGPECVGMDEQAQLAGQPDKTAVGPGETEVRSGSLGVCGDGLKRLPGARCALFQ